MTLPRLTEMKRNREPIVMVTAYDYPSAQIVDEAESTSCWSGTPPRWSSSATTRPRRSAWRRC